MRGARSSILESMKWTVQVRRAAITVRHHVHFNSDVFGVGEVMYNSPSPLLPVVSFPRSFRVRVALPRKEVAFGV